MSGRRRGRVPGERREGVPAVRGAPAAGDAIIWGQWPSEWGIDPFEQADAARVHLRGPCGHGRDALAQRGDDVRPRPSTPASSATMPGTRGRPRGRSARGYDAQAAVRGRRLRGHRPRAGETSHGRVTSRFGATPERGRSGVGACWRSSAAPDRECFGAGGVGRDSFVTLAAPPRPAEVALVVVHRERGLQPEATRSPGAGNSERFAWVAFQLLSKADELCQGGDLAASAVLEGGHRGARTRW